MNEPIRLIIWDLDETFWSGTLSEGGITLCPENRDIVVALAHRGIISSICSKNDFEAVKNLLIDNGIWNYFVFPSINWTPKGPRIKALIETIQLRAETVLFIDDNPMNLEEAKHFAAGLQTQPQSFIAQILKHPLLQGKEDSALKRLNQYKLLERRKRDEIAAGSSTEQFLRDSGIHVRLEFYVEAHLDRVIELINRTNQLNFTKVRLSEDPSVARDEIRSILKSYAVQAALVHVTDRYGDHGYCGFYAHNSENRRLLHFCFSCRILGMGVEQWVYNKLNRPQIDIRGEVLTDLLGDGGKIEWISQETRIDPTNSISARGDPILRGRVTARGGCDLGAVMHYFEATVPDVVGEYHVFRNGGTFRVDHSVFLRCALEGLAPESLRAAEKLGYDPKDFTSSLFEAPTGQNVILLSFTSDGTQALYRHRNTGLRVPFTIPGRSPREDARLVTLEQLPTNDRRSACWMPEALKFLQEDFDFFGCIGRNDYQENLRIILNGIPETAKVFVLKTMDYQYERGQTSRTPECRLVDLNAWTQDVCATLHNVETLSMSDFIRDSSEMADVLHYDRKVYFRIYQRIAIALADDTAEKVGTPLRRPSQFFRLTAPDRGHVVPAEQRTSWHDVECAGVAAFRWTREAEIVWRVQPQPFRHCELSIAIPILNEVQPGFANNCRLEVGSKSATLVRDRGVLTGSLSIEEPVDAVVKLLMPPLLRPCDLRPVSDSRALGLAIYTGPGNYCAMTLSDIC